MALEDKKYYKTVGNRIRLRRKALKMTQNDLSEKVGISYTYLSYIETGVKFPSSSVLIKLSHELGVTTDFLLRGTVYATSVDKKICDNIALFNLEDKNHILEYTEFILEKRYLQDK